MHPGVSVKADPTLKRIRDRIEQGRNPVDVAGRESTRKGCLDRTGTVREAVRYVSSRRQNGRKIVAAILSVPAWRVSVASNARETEKSTCW